MIHGHIHPDFWRVGQALEKQLQEFPGGAAVCVYHGREKVVDIWGGVMDDKGTPWHEDTMAVSFSTTKGVASTALHVCADRGLVDYDAPVCKYWPEFSQKGKHDITVRHVMTHQAGLYSIRRLVDDARNMLDWEHMVEKLAAAEPQMKPGTGSAYHAITYGWLVGELVRRVSGKSLPEFLKSEIAVPLKLDGLYIGVPKDELHRCARLVSSMKSATPKPKGARKAKKRGPDLRREILGRIPQVVRMVHALAPKGVGKFDFSDPEVAQASIPGAGGVFTARSLAKLYACLANGGEFEGVRILSQGTIDKIGVVQHKGMDKVIPIDMQWRLGYHMAGTTKGIPKGAFGHYGFGGSGAFAHPRRNLAAAMVLNGGVGSSLTADFRMPRIGGAVLDSARRREGK